MSRATRPQAIRFLCVATALLAIALAAPPAAAAVAPGDYCVVGLGDKKDNSDPDGWLVIVTPAGAVTDLTPQLTTALINPHDCAIDPTNGDIIVVDSGDKKDTLVDGSLHRIEWSGGVATQTVLHTGAPLVNPRGVVVGSDGSIYVGDIGPKDNDDPDGAVYGLPPTASLTRLDSGGVALENPKDLDLDPRPFSGTNPGLNLVIVEERDGDLLRVLPSGSSVVSIDTLGGGGWRSMEVGPYGNYFFANHDNKSVERYDRLTGSLTEVADDGGGSDLDHPVGITVDYYTGDLVVANHNAGITNVPPNTYLGGPDPTQLVDKDDLPDKEPQGIGFSPPLASLLPSTNFGMPTRRAPLPGGALTIVGPAAGTAAGDPEAELDLFIEVTDPTNPLKVRIFDPNVRDGFDGISGAFDTGLTYTLFDPSGTVLTTVAVPANGRVDLDQRIATLDTGNALSVRGPGVPLADAGLYRLRIDATSGNDTHGLGIWVEDFASYTFSAATGALHTTGPAPSLSPLDPARLFPYHERGCEFTASNFDLDLQDLANAGTALSLTTRLGEVFPLTGSGQNVHLEDTIAPAPAGPASLALDYGLHELDALMAPTASQDNLVSIRAPDFVGWVDAGGTGVPVPVPPGNPAANPTPSLRTSPAPAWPQAPYGPGTNTFLRHYLPRYDETPSVTASPYAPYLTQAALPLNVDPPVVGTPSRYLIQIVVANPDPVNALTIPALAVEVPAPTLYVDSGLNVKDGAEATGGATVTPPCDPGPCSGFIGASWTSIAPGTVEVLSFAVEVTPTAPGERLYLTGGPPVRGGGATPVANPGAGILGTYGQFTPAWSSGSFPRTESLGPLCDLSVVEGTVTPVAVELGRLDAEAGDGVVRIAWETQAEFDNLGFYVYRRLAGEAEFARVTPELILGRGTTDLSARYSYLDTSAPNGVAVEYLLEDIEFDGDTARHGPVQATPEAGLVLEPLAAADPDSQVPESDDGAVGEPGRERRERPAAIPASVSSPTASVEHVPAPLPPTSASSASSRGVAALPGVKLGLRGPGVTRVEASELQAAGLGREVDPRGLQVYRQGLELAVRIEGEEDGRLDPGDSLVVWSEGIDDRYTDEDAVFVVAGDAAGRRVPPLAALPSLPAPQRSLAALARFEQQRLYLPGVLNGEDDNFVGAYVFDQPVVSRLDTPGADGSAARLQVRLRGGTAYAAVEPDHHFQLRVEGVPVADLHFDGAEAFETSVELGAGIVAGDTLTVEIVPLFDSGAPFDLIYLDSLELHHRRELRLGDADAGSLEFVAESDGPHRVAGLADPTQARLWDVSDPDGPVELAGVVGSPDERIFEARAGARYAVVEPEGERAPARIVANTPSRWSGTAPEADWVAIVDGELLEEAERLAAHRERQGLRTLVIDVEDVYDEISDGVFTPVAIRDLMGALAARWGLPPQYLLLVGEASYDYRGFLEGRAEIGVPSMLVDTTFVETASDAFFGDLDGDGAPEIAVGRITARTPEELAAIVDKLIDYEAESSRPPAAGSWRERLLLVSDDGLGAGDPREARDFEALLDGIAQVAPPDLMIEHLRLSALPEAGQGELARAAIHAALADGRLLAFYAGHGGARAWADEGIWGSEDVLGAETAGRLPIYVVLNCLNAFFDAPNEESLAEVALRAEEHGAVAFVSSTAVTAFTGQDHFAHELAGSLLGGHVERLGDALRVAQRALAQRPEAADVLASFVLIGDPATRVALSPTPVAVPGPDLAVDWGVGVVLDGRESRSPDGARLAYSWRVADEPEPGAGSLLAEASATPSFVGLVPGSYRLELTVDDGRRRSAPAPLRIDVSGVGYGSWGCAGSQGAAAPRLSGFDFLYLMVPAGLASAQRRRRRSR